ncbi:hypothetical protein B0H13DRAFT_2439173, partial [Mycena leptocephala]
SAATAILTCLERPPIPGLTREFLTLIANAKRTAAALLARFPHIHFLSSPRVRSPSRADIHEEGVDRQMAALYYSKWMFIKGLPPALRAAHGAGEDARMAALHTAGRGGPVDLDDLGLVNKWRAEECKEAGAAACLTLIRLSQVLAARPPNAGISFTHALPGTVDTPLLRACPSATLRALHYVRFLIFPTLMFGAMSITECGEYHLYGLLQ